MSAATVARVITELPEILAGIKSGLYTVWGGVVRISKGHKGAGQIVGHLLFPSDSQQAQQALQALQAAIGDLQQGLGAIQSLQVANLALSGLNLAVSVAGFAIVCSKLNGISSQLEGQANQLNQLIDFALKAQEREQMRDTARFRASLMTISQLDEMGDAVGLKGQLSGLNEQYEYTRLVLERSASNACTSSFVPSLEMIRSFQERMMYLGFLQTYVLNRSGSQTLAVAALNKLKKDWLQINTIIVDAIAANDEWIEQLSKEDGEKIVSLLNFRKEVEPAIEYQASLLEFTKDKLEYIDEVATDSESIFFIAA